METFIYGRELDFRQSNYYQIPVFWADRFLIVKLEADSSYGASIAKMWFLPFLHGFGFARSQSVDVGEGVNLLEFSGVSDVYKLSIQPFSKVKKCSIKIWTTDYEPRATSQLNEIQSTLQYLL